MKRIIETRVEITRPLVCTCVKEKKRKGEITINEIQRERKKKQNKMATSDADFIAFRATAGDRVDSHRERATILPPAFSYFASIVFFLRRLCLFSVKKKESSRSKFSDAWSSNANRWRSTNYTPSSNKYYDRRDRERSLRRRTKERPITGGRGRAGGGGSPRLKTNLFIFE